MRPYNSLWSVGALLSSVTVSVQKAIPNGNLAARDDGLPAPQTIVLFAKATTIGGGILEVPYTAYASPEIKTVIRDGHEVTTTNPPSSYVTTEATTIDPITVQLPSTTTVVPPITKVTLCPEPTGTVKKHKTAPSPNYGCQSGFICSPRMPEGCNVWPGTPSKDFACNPEDCMPPIDTENELFWSGDEISYYRPAWGYFHLSPAIFNLTFGIYEVPSDTTRRNIGTTHVGKKRQDDDKSPIGLEGECLKQCDTAYSLGQKIGKDPDLCKTEGGFNDSLKNCQFCISQLPDGQFKVDARDEVNRELESYIQSCKGGDSSPTPGPSSNSPDPVGTPSVTQSTTKGESASTPSFSLPTPPVTPSVTSNPITSTTTTSPTTTSTTTTSTTTASTTTTSSPSSSPSSSSPSTSSPSSTSSSPSSTPTTSSTPSSTSSIATTSSTPVPSSSSSETSESTESTPSATSGSASTSGTLSTSSSASVESSSTGSPGSLSSGSPSPDSTSLPEESATSSTDASSTSSSSSSSPSSSSSNPSSSASDVPSTSTGAVSTSSDVSTGISFEASLTSSAETSASSKPSDSVSLTSSAESAPSVPAPIPSTGPSGTGPTISLPGPSDIPVPTGPDSQLPPVPSTTTLSSLPIGTPGAPTPSSIPPGSSGSRLSMGATLLATLLTFIVLLA